MKVGYVIAVHNRAKEVRYAIRSIFRQTRLPDYLSVVDDASTDGSYFAVEEEFLSKPDGVECQVQIVEKQTNAALVKQLGVKALPPTDVIIVLDSDDYVAPNYIENALEVFKNHPEVAIAYPDMLYFVTDGSKDKNGMPLFTQHKYYRIPEFSKETYRKHHYICTGSAVRTKAFWQVGGWSDTQLYDSHFWVKVIVAGWEAKRMPSTLYYYKVHLDENQLSKQRSAELRKQGMEDIEKVWRSAEI